jgi:hypothetical protein
LFRFLKYKVLLTCAGPEAYYGKDLQSLRYEDPGKRCDYSGMIDNCVNDGWLSLEISIILFVLILILIISISLLVYRNYVLAKRVEKLKTTLSKVDEKPKVVVSSNQPNNSQPDPKDKDKLLTKT